MHTGVKNLCPMFVLTFLLNGWLYQSMLLLSAFALGVCRWFVFESGFVSAFVLGFLEWGGAFIE